MAAPVSSALLGSAGKTNYARLGQAAQHELPNILRELLLVKMLPSSLHYRVCQNHTLVRRLRPSEILMIKNAAINGYSNFDTPLMYTLIRYLDLVPPPTRGWDPPTDPTSTEISVGDDVERIRRKRNEIFHRGNVNVSDTELADHFKLFKDIASRLENYLGKSNKEFVSLIEHLEKCNMDTKPEQWYLHNLKQLLDKEWDIEKDIVTIKRGIEKDIVTIKRGIEKDIVTIKRIYEDKDTYDLDDDVDQVVCGMCKETFRTLDKYMLHKKQRDKSRKSEAEISEITIRYCTDDFRLVDHYGYLAYSVLCDELKEDDLATNISIRKRDYIFAIDAISFTQDKFYKMKISCGCNVVDCIVDSRLEETCLEIVKVFEGAKTMLQSHNVTKEQFSEYLFQTIESKKPMISHFLLLHQTFDTSVLKEALNLSLDGEEQEIAKAISLRICSNFLKTLDITLEIEDAWLGFLCKCKKVCDAKKWFCSKDLAMILIVQSEIANIMKCFFGIPVHQVALNSARLDEAQFLSEQRAKIEESGSLVQIHIPGILAEQLFNKHSRLTLICSSEFKSTCFEGKNKVKRCLCIQLFCQVKGIIPIGENHFPSTIQGIPTDVIEGIPQFCSGKIKVGDVIGSSSSHGTLGGFCRRYGKDCFLTCAHVMLDWETLVLPKRKQHDNPYEATLLTRENGVDKNVPCGQLIHHIFNHGNPNTTSTDAALILINDTVSIDENDFASTNNGAMHFSQFGLNSKYIENKYITSFMLLNGKKIDVLSVGAESKIQRTFQCETTTKEESIIRVEDVQSSSANFARKVHHLVTIFPTHAQITKVIKLTREEDARVHRTFRFYNQLAFDQVPFKPGDSGGCIYIPDKWAETGCLALAIASLPGGGCIGTPVSDILRDLGII